MTEQQQAVSDGIYIESNKVTLGEFLTQYYANKTLRPKTRESYQSLLNIHIIPDLGAIRLTELTPGHIDTFYASKRKVGLSERTIQYMHSIIHKSLDQAMRRGLVARNVTDLVDKPVVKRKAPVIWTDEQIDIFLNAIKENRFFPLFVLAVATGAREGELLAIHYEDIDWSTGTLHIKQALQYLIGKGLVLTEPKTQKGKRSIPLPDYALNVLKDHCDKLNRNQGFTFVTGNGTPFSPRNLVRYFKTVIKDNDLPDIRFHDLRHYHGSFLLSKGVNSKVVQERLGHSQISLTMDTYSHTIPSLQKEAASKANEIFKQ